MLTKKVSADQAPNTNPDVIGNIGTIEVVVLRLAEAAGQNEVQSTHKSKAANNSQLKAKTRPDVLKGAAQRETFDVRSAMESFSALFDGSADEGYRRIGPYDESWGGRDHLRRWYVDLPYPMPLSLLSPFAPAPKGQLPKTSPLPQDQGSGIVVRRFNRPCNLRADDVYVRNSLSRRPERYDFPLGPRDSSENAPRRRSEYRYDQYDSARRNLDSGRQGYPSVHGHSRTGHPLTGYENNHFPRLPHENYGHEVPNHWYPNNNSEYPYRTLTHQIPLRAERSGHGGRDRRTHHDIRDFDGPSYPSPYHQPGRLVRPMLHEFEARQQAGDIPPNRPYGANYGRPSAWENRWEEYPRTRATFSYGDELYRPTLPDPALRDEAPRRRFTHREHGPGNYPGSPPPWKSYTKHLGRGHQSRAYDPYEPDTWQREGHASGISNGSSNGYGSGESKDSIDNHNGRPSRRYKWHSRHHTWDGRQERPSNRNEKGSWSHNVHRGATGNQGRWSNGNAGGWNDNNQAGGNNEDQAGWNNGGSGGRNYETHQQSNHNNPEVQNEGHQGGWNNNSPDQPNNENQGDANGNNPNNWNGGNQVGWNSNSPGRKNNDDRGGWNTGSAGQLNNNDQGYNAEDNHGGRWDDSSKHKHKSKQNKDGNRKSSRMGSGRSRESSTDMGSQGNRKSSSSQGNNERPNSNDGQWNTNQNNNGQWNTSNAEVAPKLPTIHSEGPLKLEIKPYWTSWQKAKKESSADKKKLSRAELVYTEPEEPLHVIPEKTAREKQVDHQVKIGRGAAYWHQVGRPEYLDTMEAPYAVFSFKYRSKGKHPPFSSLLRCLNLLS